MDANQEESMVVLVAELDSGTWAVVRVNWAPYGGPESDPQAFSARRGQEGYINTYASAPEPVIDPYMRADGWKSIQTLTFTRPIAGVA